jgi:hypothetical protein
LFFKCPLFNKCPLFFRTPNCLNLREREIPTREDLRQAKAE